MGECTHLLTTFFLANDELKQIYLFNIPNFISIIENNKKSRMRERHNDIKF